MKHYSIDRKYYSGVVSPLPTGLNAGGFSVNSSASDFWGGVGGLGTVSFSKCRDFRVG